jgi:hypothetical protein
MPGARLPTRGVPKSQILTARRKAFRFILRFDFASFYRSMLF